ncbi:MAG: DsbC family protein [Desulfobacteraceae bacterium]|nr:MAG: DsbC family protein [Desulfobacteraceae bacterium]
MKKNLFIICALFVSPFLVALLLSSPAPAFVKDGCGSGQCTDCHSLTKEEAGKLLDGMVTEVLEVKLSEVPGLWVVDVTQKDRKIPIYIDFSKKFIISGSIVRLATREDVTKERFINLNRIDPALIPLEDAVVIGDRTALHKIIVFDDPECSYCRKIHPEMKKVVADHPEIAFFIKMFPLKIHPTAYQKAKAIVCDKSAELLDQSLAGNELPAPSCETDQIDRNIKLAEEIHIESTPTLIYPDGRVIPGYKPAEQIVELLSKQ